MKRIYFGKEIFNSLCFIKVLTNRKRRRSYHFHRGIIGYTSHW